ncbi:9122_t:CDS:10 [Diversispora eburnea]|uniref:9122_t:CDS:1 n=1 Tax=Diversispora eburnea TaxID=1213867 RepID=A0A9N8VL23_9GLOM|nr:9122_t:CDS:10 [Diversispora eburnea]
MNRQIVPSFLRFHIRTCFKICKRSFSTPATLTPAESRLFGQPTPKTHPHLMKPGEITPGISAIEYELRRTTLMNKLPENSVAISLGYRTRYMSNKVFYPFHQNTDFFYLCGFNEPDAAIVLGTLLDDRNDTRRGYKMTMFVPPKNRSVEMWDGPRTGVLGAAMESARFNSKIKEIIKNYKEVYIDLPPRTNILSTDNVQKNISRTHVKPLSKLIQDLRIIKSDSEIALMKKAGEITGNAFIQTMKFTKPGILEHDLYAKMDFECRMRGAPFLADYDLVLMDAGGEYHGYASDVTRTWPVNGKFTAAQRELYEVVLNINRHCINLCTEARDISLNGIHEVSVQIMKEELQKLGFNIVEGDVDHILYPHHVGHYLGLDVHDTHDLDRSRRLLHGMVITIEPGIYVPPNDAYPKKYHGIGIRIEDNVLVGRTDPIVLSSIAPKEIVDIEYCIENS